MALKCLAERLPSDDPDLERRMSGIWVEQIVKLGAALQSLPVFRAGNAGRVERHSFLRKNLEPAVWRYTRPSLLPSRLFCAHLDACNSSKWSSISYPTRSRLWPTSVIDRVCSPFGQNRRMLAMYSSRFGTPASASTRRPQVGYSTLSTQPNLTAWASAYRFAIRLSLPMAAGYGRRTTPGRGRRFRLAFL